MSKKVIISDRLDKNYCFSKVTFVINSISCAHRRNDKA